MTTFDEKLDIIQRKREATDREAFASPFWPSPRRSLQDLLEAWERHYGLTKDQAIREMRRELLALHL